MTLPNYSWIIEQGEGMLNGSGHIEKKEKTINEYEYLWSIKEWLYRNEGITVVKE